MFDQAYGGAQNIPAVSRRLTCDSEVELCRQNLGQPVDIELSLEHGTKDLPNMPGYPRRSLNAALTYIDHCRDLGLSKFLIRIVQGGDESKDTSYSACLKRLRKQAHSISTITAAFPEAQIFVDPFGLALGQNDQWGVTSNGVLHADLTESLFSEAVGQYAQAGASWILTLGRFPREVLVAKEKIRHIGSEMRVCTFSTNVETSQAYAYLNSQESYRDSKQKVLPQNVGEMITWALIDMSVGADMIIIKPSDNIHVLLRLIQLAQCPKSRNKFLKLPQIQKLAECDTFVAQQLSKLSELNEPIEAEYGSYAISGVYAADQVLRERKGEEFYLTNLFERFSTIAATAALGGEECVTIFDRSVSTFVAANE